MSPKADGWMNLSASPTFSSRETVLTEAIFRAAADGTDWMRYPAKPDAIAQAACDILQAYTSSMRQVALRGLHGRVRRGTVAVILLFPPRASTS